VEKSWVLAVDVMIWLLSDDGGAKALVVDAKTAVASAYLEKVFMIFFDIC